jgi:hypothetical protein
MSAVKEKGAALQPGEQCLREVMDHSPARERPGRSQDQFDDAVEGEQRESTKGCDGEQSKRRRLKANDIKDRGQQAGQWLPAQDMVGDEFQRPRLKRGQCRSDQR